LKTWWRLPDWLPDDPNPRAASALYLLALPASFCGLLGFFLGTARLRRRPGLGPIIGWGMIGMIGMFAASWYLPTVAIGAFGHARFYSYATGSVVVMLGLGFQAILKLWPRVRVILWILIFLQVGAFWWLLLSGPYYGFQDPCPVLGSP